MSGSNYPRGNSYETMSAYRRKQQTTEMLLPFFWIGIMLLIVLAGYLVYRFLSPEGKQVAEAGTATATNAETAGAEAAGTPSVTSGQATQAGAPAAAAATEAVILPTSTPSQMTYTVQEGDTLAGIATFFETDLATLMAMNPSVTPEMIGVGDELTVPGRAATETPPPLEGQSYTEYTVASGDTLAGIATNFGTTIDAIVQANGLASADQIMEGQSLRIPVPAGSVTPETVATGAIETETNPAATEPVLEPPAVTEEVLPQETPTP